MVMFYSPLEKGHAGRRIRPLADTNFHELFILKLFRFSQRRGEKNWTRMTRVPADFILINFLIREIRA